MSQMSCQVLLRSVPGRTQERDMPNVPQHPDHGSGEDTHWGLGGFSLGDLEETSLQVPVGL